MKSENLKKVYNSILILLVALLCVGCGGIDASYKDLKSPCGTSAAKRKPLNNPK